MNDDTRENRASTYKCYACRANGLMTRFMDGVIMPIIVIFVLPVTVIFLGFTISNVLKDECQDSLPVGLACQHKDHRITASSYGPLCVCKRAP